MNGQNWKFIGGGGREEKGEGSRGENPVLMKAMIFFIVSHLHFEKTDGFESNQLAEYKSMFCAMRLIKMAVKFFPTTDKSLVIACVLNDKVSKTVYS